MAWQPHWYVDVSIFSFLYFYDYLRREIDVFFPPLFLRGLVK